MSTRSDSLKKFYSNPENRKKQSYRLKNWYSNPENRIKKSEECKISFSTEEIKQLRSSISKKMWKNPKYRVIQSDKMKMSWKNKSRRLRTTLSIKRYWDSLTPSQREDRLRHILRPSEIKKTKPELKVETILNCLFPNEYRYVGNGEVTINGFFPDFINTNGQKKIIEVYGDFWHGSADMKKRDRMRIGSFSRLGYKTLVIWEKELRDIQRVSARIMEFHHV